MRGKKSSAPDIATPVAIPLPPGDKGVLAHNLQLELMALVPVFGKVKVTIGFNGDTAFCSKRLKYVNLPALPPTRVIPTRIAQELRGFAAHEAAHLIWTEDSVFPGMLTDEEKEDPLLKEVWNAIEDYLIERNWLELYPGAHKNFSATEHRCCVQYLGLYTKEPDIAKDLRSVASVALTWARAVNFNLKTTLSMDCMKTMPDALQQRVWGWFNDEMVPAENTFDALEAARRIVVDIRANPIDPNDPPANYDPQNTPPPGGGSGNGSSGHAPQQGAHEPAPLPVGHKLDDLMKEIGGGDGGNIELSFASLSTMTTGPMAAQLGDNGGWKRAADMLKQADVAHSMATIATSLRRALQALAKDRTRTGCADGVIDDKRLAGVLLGHTDIYKQKIIAPRIDTAVEILVDCSSSMRGHKLAVTQQLGLILQSAFSGTPIKVEVVGFTSGDSSSLPDNIKIMQQAIREETGKQPDISSLALYEFKNFDAPHGVAMNNLGNVQNVDLGGTPTGAAILAAHERLSRRRERRHVMFVVTDGAPDDDIACAQAVKAVERAGVTVLGIGIGSSAVSSSFTNHVVLNDVKTLSAVVVSTMTQMLTKDRAKVGLKDQTHNQFLA